MAHDEPTAWHDDEALGEEVRGEDIDGALVVSRFPGRQHQSASRRLANLLEAHAPDGTAVTGRGWMPGDDEHGPDVMVHPRTEEQVRFTGTPLLCVEVLSSDRSDDLVRKVFKHARAGLPAYRVLDPLEPSLRSHVLHGGEHRQVASVTGTGEVPGWPGTVVDVPALLAP